MISHITYQAEDTIANLRLLESLSQLEVSQFYFANDENLSYYSESASVLIGPILGTEASMKHIVFPAVGNHDLSALYPGAKYPNPIFVNELATNQIITVNNAAEDLYKTGQLVIFRQYDIGTITLAVAGTQNIRGPLATVDQDDTLYLLRINNSNWISWIVTEAAASGGTASGDSGDIQLSNGAGVFQSDTDFNFQSSSKALKTKDIRLSDSGFNNFPAAYSEAVLSFKTEPSGGNQLVQVLMKMHGDRDVILFEYIHIV